MNRITIVLDDDNAKRARAYQVRMIEKTNGAYSFSRCINDLLRGKGGNKK